MFIDIPALVLAGKHDPIGSAFVFCESRNVPPQGKEYFAEMDV